MWFFFALTFAATSSLGVILAKRIMRGMDEYLYLWLGGIFTIPFLFLIIIYFYQIPRIDNVFLFVISVSILLDVLAAIFAYRAIRISEVSLVAPISAFNPVFTAIISLIVLGEAVNLRGWAGILLVCVGAYILQLSKKQKGLFYPIKTLLTHKGVVLSLIAYFIWAITPIFQKTAILHTSPQVPPFASFAGMLGTNIIFGLIAAKFSKIQFSVIKNFLPLLLFVGVLGGVGQASAFIAFSLTNLGFATSIFKLSMIFTVILGSLFFRERDIKDRLLGSIVMLIGVIFLAT